MGFRMAKILYPFSKEKSGTESRTAFEQYRELFKNIRSAAGESTYLLSCMVRHKRVALVYRLQSLGTQHDHPGASQCH
jgi:hypothetical protein